MIRADVDLLVANEHELKSLYLTDDLAAAMARAEAEVPITACTVGAAGRACPRRRRAGARPGDQGRPWSTPPAPATSSPPAFSTASPRGRDWLTCARMGCVAAGEVISHIGARPEADLRALFAAEGLALSVGAPDPADIPAAPPRADNPRLGIALMILTSMIFACQDGMSRYLGAPLQRRHRGDDPLLVLRRSSC